MCLWQLWDVGDGFGHQHPLYFNISVGHQHPKDVTDIEILSLTSKNCYQDKVTNIFVAVSYFQIYDISIKGENIRVHRGITSVLAVRQNRSFSINELECRRNHCDLWPRLFVLSWPGLLTKESYNMIYKIRPYFYSSSVNEGARSDKFDSNYGPLT